MKVHLRTWLTLLILTACLGLSGGAVATAHGQATADAPSASQAGAEKPSDDADSTEQFRHAPIVKAIARALHLPAETAAQIAEDINSGILIFAILFLLFRTLPKAFRGRTATIQKQLVEARTATEAANERLSAVEAKLARIGDDIETIRLQTERDSVEDEKRIKQSLEDERLRIVKSAEQEIESAGATAKRDLKRFAAELAVDNAAKRIQLSAETDQAIVARFGQDLIGQFGKGGRN